MRFLSRGRKEAIAFLGGNFSLSNGFLSILQTPLVEPNEIWNPGQRSIIVEVVGVGEENFLDDGRALSLVF